jgi:hypothetical protein
VEVGLQLTLTWRFDSAASISRVVQSWRLRCAGVVARIER